LIDQPGDGVVQLRRQVIASRVIAVQVVHRLASMVFHSRNCQCR
jgi:hypothetical protein